MCGVTARFTSTLIFGLSIMYAAGPKCISRNGNIECEIGEGTHIVLTRTGIDLEPSVSILGNRAVFLRRRGSAQCDEIWASEIKEGSEAVLLFGGRVEHEGRGGCRFQSPMLSDDHSTLYFLVEYAATTSFLVEADLRSKSYRFVQPAIRFLIMPCGKYQGNLLIQQRRVTLAGVYYYYFWLYDRSGKEIGLAARDDDELIMFTENACEQ